MLTALKRNALPCMRNLQCKTLIAEILGVFANFYCFESRVNMRNKKARMLVPGNHAPSDANGMSLALESVIFEIQGSK